MGSKKIGVQDPRLKMKLRVALMQFKLKFYCMIYIIGKMFVLQQNLVLMVEK